MVRNRNRSIPAGPTRSAPAAIQNDLFEGLVILDPDDHPQPAAAESGPYPPMG